MVMTRRSYQNRAVYGAPLNASGSEVEEDTPACEEQQSIIIPLRIFRPPPLPVLPIVPPPALAAVAPPLPLDPEILAVVVLPPAFPPPVPGLEPAASPLPVLAVPGNRHTRQCI